MSARTLLLGLGLALAAGAGGCLLVDTGDLKILPDGPLEADTTLRIRLACPCTRVALEMDGRALVGEFPVGEDLTVNVDGALALGEHQLRARALDGQPRTATRTFTILRTFAFLTDVSPPEGTVPRLDPASTGPFKVRVSFNRPLAASRVGQAVKTGGEAATATVLADGVTLEVTYARSLHELDAAGRGADLDVSAELLEPPWPGQRFVFAWKLGPRLQTTVEIPEVFPTRGPVEVAFRVKGAPPPWIDVRIGAVATFRALPPTTGDLWRVSWDGSAAPEGSYAITYAVPPDFTVSFTGSRVVVDRTPPQVTGECARIESGLPSRNECVYVPVFDATTPSVASAVFRSGGTTRGRLDVPPGWRTLEVCPEPLPLDQQAASEELEVTFKDLVGNVSAPVTCTVPTPSWEPYVDRDRPPAWVQFPPGSSVWSALRPEVQTVRSWNAGPRLLVVAAAGTTGEGQLYAWSGGDNAVVRNQTTSAVDRAGPGWVERGLVYAYLSEQTIAGPLNLDATRDARDVSWSLEGGEPTIAWSEAAAAGRQLVVRNRFAFLGAPERRASDAVAEAPSFSGSAVAWLETTPGGRRTLRLAQLGLVNGPASRWDLLIDDGNLDPAADAAEPSLYRDFSGTVLAWREGGRLLARYLAPVYGATFSPAAVLNADPARAARNVRAGPGTVTWIEDSADGDQIRVAAWSGTGWLLAPVPANAGVPGPVRAMDAGNTASVTWLRADGGLEFRAASCLH